MDEIAPEPATQEGTVKDRLREQERRHAFLLMLGDRLRGRSDPVAIMATASEALGRHLAVSRVGYGEIDLDEQTVHVERDGGQLGRRDAAARRFRAGHHQGAAHRARPAAE
jgi:hypothetical protein